MTEEKLVGQHHDALDAVRALINAEAPDDKSLEAIQAGFQGALAHAEHCGSLISRPVDLTRKRSRRHLKN